MKKLLFLLVAMAMMTGVSYAQQVPQSTEQMQLSFAPLVKKTSPAVVNIYTKRVVEQQMRVISPFFNDPFFGQFFGQGMFGGPVRKRLENALGSGVIVDENGMIVTNNHVIKDADEITVIMADSREFVAAKILADPKTDVAILKVDTKGEKLPFLQLSDSDALQVGDLVLAIGNPFGVGQTVTSGIVSGLARTDVGISDYSFFIQTDAAINPGNSGGALIDMQGRLVGVNTAIFSRTGGSIGIGFAIPANMVQTVIEASKNGGKIVRPWTGISGQAVTPDMVESLKLKKAYGALVTKIHMKGPAAKAGVKAGDVILAMNGRELQDPQALKFRLATVPLGTSVTLTLWRNGAAQDVSMTAEAAPEDPPRNETTIKGSNPLQGAVVANISPAVQEETGITQDTGVVILQAQEGAAARLGLGTGDVILTVNGKKIVSVDDLKNLVKDIKSNRWMFEIMRGDRVLNLAVSG